MGFGTFVENGMLIINNIKTFGYVLITCGISLFAISLFIKRQNPIKLKNRALILLISSIGIFILTISKLITVILIGEVNRDSLWAGAGVLIGSGLVFYLIRDLQNLQKENNKNSK
jgi:hypothetical protein